MKLKCIAPDHGYEHCLTKGKEYEIQDIQYGVFSGTYYIIVAKEHSDNGKEVVCHSHRFDVTEERCRICAQESWLASRADKQETDNGENHENHT